VLPKAVVAEKLLAKQLQHVAAASQQVAKVVQAAVPADVNIKIYSKFADAFIKQFVLC
jgi:hypothetical protein